SLQIQIALRDYNYSLALELLQKHAPQLNNPLLWYNLAYRILYRTQGLDFAKARAIYDAYDEFTHPLSQLPNEDNTYNYTEIYSTVCKENLLQGQDFDQFNHLKTKFRKGELTPDEAFREVTLWTQKFPKN